jgi:hypothetical protein
VSALPRSRKPSRAVSLVSTPTGFVGPSQFPRRFEGDDTLSAEIVLVETAASARRKRVALVFVIVVFVGVVAAVAGGNILVDELVLYRSVVFAYPGIVRFEGIEQLQHC